jgi:hypothetical protein
LGFCFFNLVSIFLVDMEMQMQREEDGGLVDTEADGGGHHHHADEARLEVGGEVLPLELTIHVLSFLDARDRLSLALVSRPFRVLADDDLYPPLLRPFFYYSFLINNK